MELRRVPEVVNPGDILQILTENVFQIRQALESARVKRAGFQ